jgi:hypothetical protein
MYLPSSIATTSFLIVLISSVVCAQDDTSDMFFGFRQDIRVFTAQACENAAGYDHEWRKAGMHPLRTEIRAELFRILDSSYIMKLRAFDATCKGDWSTWASYALLTTGPPDFKLSYDPQTTPFGDNTRDDMPGLSNILADFYVNAHIPTLWQKYGPRLQSYNDKFRPYARRALVDITEYCRLDKNYFRGRASHMHVVFAPLLSYFNAFNEKVGDEIYLVFGPQVSEPSPSSFYHEVLHHVISPLTEKLDTNETKRIHELFALATSGEHLGYSHVDEGFVRTLDCVIGGRREGWTDSTIEANVTHEYKLGFILCLAIYEQLKQYEASSETFAEFFPRILPNINIEREKRRWQLLTKSPK